MFGIEIAIVLLVFLVCIYNLNNDYLLFNILILAFLLRLIFIILDLYLFKINFSIDADGFELKAFIWSLEGFNYAISNFFTEGYSFIYANFLSTIYSLTGRSIFLAKLINTIVSLVSIYYFYRLTNLIWNNKKYTFLSTLIFAFMPFYVIITLLLERVCNILINFSFTNFLSIQKKIKYLLISIILSFLHIYFHGPMVLI